MKITVITGSAHRKGTSALLAEKFIEGAREAGHDVFRFDAAFKNVHGCIGCDTCIRKGACAYKDDMTELNPHILEADIIAFFSPIYYYNINAQIKAVMDRFYANNSALQGRKKAILFTTMADDEMKSAEAAKVFFDNYTEYMEWENLGTHSAKAVWTVDDMRKTAYPEEAYRIGLDIK